MEEQQVFDRVHSLVKCFSLLNSSCKFNLAKTLGSNRSVLLPNLNSLSGQPLNPRLVTLSSLLMCCLNIIRARSTPFFYPLRLVRSLGINIRLEAQRLSLFLFWVFDFFEREKSCNFFYVSSSCSTIKEEESLEFMKLVIIQGRIINLISNSLEINLLLFFGLSEIDENYLFFFQGKFHFFPLYWAYLFSLVETFFAFCWLNSSVFSLYIRTRHFWRIHLVERVLDISLKQLPPSTIRLHKNVRQSCICFTSLTLQSLTLQMLLLSLRTNMEMEDL